MKAFAKTIVGAAAGLLIGLGSAQAASVEATLFDGLQQLSDNSAESLIDTAGLGGTAGKVDVGDRLRGIFTIETVEQTGNPTRLLGTAGNDELSGIFDVTVATKTPVGSSFAFTFKPTLSFAAEAGGNAGAMVAFYQDASPDYSRLAPACTTTGFGGDCEGLAGTGTGGSLLWVAGFTGTDAFESWSAFAISDDISVIGAIAPPGNGGLFNIGLNLLANYGGKQLGNVACGVHAVTTLEFCGSGSLLGKLAGSPYDSFDNVDFVINVVPEPASLALTGLALLGLAAASRRGRARSN